VPKQHVFVSYHHERDQSFKDLFVEQFGSAFLDYSVRDGAIDDALGPESIGRKIREEFIRQATVVIVLVGQDTWKCKHVDWEISAALRASEPSARAGLLGIILPTYLPPWELLKRARSLTRLSISDDDWQWRGTEPERAAFCPQNIPPRLWDNVSQAGYAMVRPWPSSATELADWIDVACARRERSPRPTLARELYAKNRSEDELAWR
jgi:hypothetical protein